MNEENNKTMNEVSLGRVQGNNVYIKFNYLPNCLCASLYSKAVFKQP